jgi:hypothetical protein
MGKVNLLVILSAMLIASALDGIEVTEAIMLDAGTHRNDDDAIRAASGRTYGFMERLRERNKLPE